ncbi:hypothetical protein F5Y09DRAFT_54440 [Xylaria sp. FL1042]|nr:hypothetical protein F5Y09DRAFT_54440 [Xylaria sp. FL1042]
MHCYLGLGLEYISISNIPTCRRYKIYSADTIHTDTSIVGLHPMPWFGCCATHSGMYVVYIPCPSPMPSLCYVFYLVQRLVIFFVFVFIFLAKSGLSSEH